MHWTSLVGLALALVFTTHTARADTCDTVRAKAVGRLECGLLNCQAKAAVTNDGSRLEACTAKAQAKFSRAWPAGGCPDDGTACSEAAAACESAMVRLLADTPPSKCEARKRRAAGKLARAELDCYARTGPNAVDVACIEKAQNKFDRAVAAAGACPDGGAPRDAVEQSCVSPALKTYCSETGLPPLPPELMIPVCCEAGICFGGTVVPGTQGQYEYGMFLSQCGRGGGGTHLGSTCQRVACPPELPPDTQCGTCEEVPFQTATVCCQQEDACFDQAVSTWLDLLDVPCNLPPAGSDGLTVGTCNANGRCVPGS